MRTRLLFVWSLLGLPGLATAQLPEDLTSSERYDFPEDHTVDIDVLPDSDGIRVAIRSRESTIGEAVCSFEIRRGTLTARMLLEEGTTEILTVPRDLGGPNLDSVDADSLTDLCIIGLVDEFENVYFLRVRGLGDVEARVPVFLNTVNHATIQYAGGPVEVD